MILGEIMIPKILHFIWISINGTKMPEYGRFAISKFREMNPDFEINVIDIPNMVTQQDWAHSVEKFPILQEAIVEGLDKKIQLTNRFKQQCQEMKFNDTDFWNVRMNIPTYISDSLRFKLIEKYGGIYLDLDCFPLKPFDSNLLNQDGFYMQCNFHPGEDICFIGGQKGYTHNNCRIIRNPFLGKMCCDEFKQLYLKFMNGTITSNDLLEQKDIDSYIYHFYCGSKY